MPDGPREDRALLHEAVRSMAQQVASIALVTNLADDALGPTGASVPTDALAGVGRAAGAALAELRLIVRVLQEADHDVELPAPASLVAVAEECRQRLHARGIDCRWTAPPDVDTLPDTTRTSLSLVLGGTTEAVLGTHPTPGAVDVEIVRGRGAVDLDVVVTGGVDVALAEALLGAVSTRVKRCGGEISSVESGTSTSRSWSLWVWLRC